MPATASCLDTSKPAPAARNSYARYAQGVLGEGILSRMPFIEDTPAVHSIDKQQASISSSSAAEIHAPANRGLAARMQLLIRSAGSMASIARRCGFSEGAVRSWRDGQSDISRERCVVMARTLGISLIWLITGEGSMHEIPLREDSPTKVSMDTSHAATPPASRSTADEHDHGTNENGKSARTQGTAVNPRVLAAALRLLQSYIGLLGGSLNPAQRADVLAELYDIINAASDPDYIDRLIIFHTRLSGLMRSGASFVA